MKFNAMAPLVRMIFARALESIKQGKQDVLELVKTSFVMFLDSLFHEISKLKTIAANLQVETQFGIIYELIQSIVAILDHPQFFNLKKDFKLKSSISKYVEFCYPMASASLRVLGNVNIIPLVLEGSLEGHFSAFPDWEPFFSLIDVPEVHFQF